MNITLVSAINGLSHFTLPPVVEGHFDLRMKRSDGTVMKIGDIEADQGAWAFVPLPSFERLAPSESSREEGGEPIYLTPMEFYQFTDSRTTHRFTMFVEPDSSEYKTFRLYKILTNRTILIGREEGAIAYDCAYISRRHVSVEGMRLRDLGSTNGTYVNGRIVNECDLQYGDILEIFGLKLIFLKNGIAINDIEGKVKLDDSVFRPYHLALPKVASGHRAEAALEIKPFERSPRIRRVIKPERIELEAPPESHAKDSNTPLILTMGASLTMGMSSAMMALVAIQNASGSGNWSSAVPSIVMSVSMLSSSIIFPMFTRRFEKKRSLEQENLRQSKYVEYLYDTVDKLQNIESTQKSILLETYLSTQEICMMIDAVDRRLWNRRIEHEDFLTIRLGLGEYQPESELVFPKKGLMLKSDPMRKALAELEARPHKMTGVPVTLNLRKARVFGIVGEGKWAAKYMECLLVQLGAMHSPDEMKLIFLYRDVDGALWEYSNWFPHVWNDAQDFRMVATDNEEVRLLSSYLEGVLTEENERSAGANAHYVVISNDKSLLDRCGVLNSVLMGERKALVSFIAVAERMSKLPKECETILELREERGYLFQKVDAIERLDSFVLESPLKKTARCYSTKLLNMNLSGNNESTSLPDMLTFFDMFRIGRVEHLNAHKRWTDSNPIATLTAPVGVDSYGDLFTLDIHQNAHGPHGLVAGMTGSGKSEFIITFILSLAASYSPLEVGFILIDYKGGGMSDTLKDLPHVVGIIDNLGGRQGIRRSMVSIQSELSRRQRVFKEIGKQLDVSNLDIHKYQGMVREGQIKEPMQHLIIVSDEFAELKQQEPDFMNQLISTARIGRSLGVHLILATQKPAGVVNEQILSNTRFRACLKVQDRNDSMDMINRPDAASLTKTGRFYLQVGYNEIFSMGQSAWSGAPSIPQDRYVEPVDESIEVINSLGQVVLKTQAKPEKAKEDKKPLKQVDDTVDYLSRVATEHGLIPDPLWKPMLRADLLLEEVCEFDAGGEEAFMNPAIGVVDDPTVQQQFALRVPLDENVLLYGATGSGKTMFVNALLMELTTKYSPDEVNIFILDFASQASRAFLAMPHVGDVIVAGEDEKVRNFIKMIGDEAERRRALFNRFGGDIDVYRRESGEKIPNMLVILQNYSSFSELYEREEEALYPYTRDGQRYGISFLFTAVSMSSVRFRMTQNFKHIYCLQLNDAVEYASLLGRTEGIVPMPRRGSGIYNNGERVLEFQVGALFPSGTENEFDRIGKISDEIRGKYQGMAARNVRVMPEVVAIGDVVPQNGAVPLNRMPLGLRSEDMETMYADLTDRYIHMFLYAAQDAGFVRGLCALLALGGERDVFILDPRREIRGLSGEKCRVANRGKELEGTVAALFEEVVKRYNAYDLAEEEKTEPPVFPEMVIFANGLSDVFDQLDEDRTDKLSLILEKGSPALNVAVIFFQAANAVSKISAMDWYLNQISATDGYWIGDGLLDQFTFRINAQRGIIEGNRKMSFVIKGGEPTAFKPVQAYGKEARYDQG